MMNEVNPVKIMENKIVFAFETGEFKKRIAGWETRPRTLDFRLIPVF